jgi:hypothetical protein
VVISQIHVVHAAILKAKNDPPVGSHGDAPELFEIAFKAVQPKARQVHILGVAGAIQNGKDVFDLGELIGANPTSVPFSKSCFKPLCLKL